MHLPNMQQRLPLPHRLTQPCEEVQRPVVTIPDAAIVFRDWRPLTLLNVDYKILAKVIGKRIESILSSLIHSDQTGFINGRFIGQNVRLLNDIIEYTGVKKLPGSFFLLIFVRPLTLLSGTLSTSVLNCITSAQSLSLSRRSSRVPSESSFDRDGGRNTSP